MIETLQAAAALVQATGEGLTPAEHRRLSLAREYLDRRRTLTLDGGRWRVVGTCYDPEAGEVVTLRAIGPSTVWTMTIREWRIIEAEALGHD